MLKFGLDLRAQSEVPPGEDLPLFVPTSLSRVYFPARGLLYSLLIHEVFILGLFFLPAPRGVAEPVELAQRPERVTRIIRSDPKTVLWLPILGGGNEGLGKPGGGSGAGPARSKGPSVAATPGSRGMSYPGPQPILSDPPDPTNRIQTLLQPDLQNLPVLPPPIPLPNIVQIADAGPVPQLEPPAPAVKPPDAVKAAEPQPVEQSEVQPQVREATVALPPLKLAPLNPIDAPKLVLPAGVFQSDTVPGVEPPSVELPKQVRAIPAPPDPAPKQVQLPEMEPPTLEPLNRQLSPVPSRGPDPRNLLALTPMPAPPMKPFEVPPGEARGRFAISPEPNLAATETEPGLKRETESPTAGVGSSIEASTGKATPLATAGTGTGAAKDKETTGGGTGTGPGSGPGSGTGSGTGSGAGSGAGTGSGSGTGPGAGSRSGPGVGTGSGAGSGTGSGAGSGPGRGAFSGITIIGGVSDTGAATNPASPPPAPRPLKNSYGLTVISTESSGGGLPYFGVFSNAQVYTVYLDMRETEVDQPTSWTLEYALHEGTDGQADPGKSQQGIVLPYPAVKEQPVFPSEVVRKYLRRMVIVYGVINIEGKMEQMSVKDSPDPQLNEPLLNSLGKWVFRPGQLHGEPVAMKVLIGIPLRLPQ